MSLRIAAVVVASLGLAVLALPGCSSASSTDPEASSAAVSGFATCARFAPEATDRKVVVSHPFGDDPNRYEVLKLSNEGVLARTNVVFEMGRSNLSVPIVFTPDGQIGLAAQEGGTVGVFRLTAGGQVEVLDPGWNGGFYARELTMDPTGTRVFAADANTADNGGGVYEIAIGCDGKLVSRGLVVPGGLAQAMALFPSNPGRAVLAAGKAFGSAPASNTFLLDVGGAPALKGESDAWGDPDAQISTVGVTFDGKYALVGDAGISVGDRLSVVNLATMKPRQVLSTRAPFAIVTSPWNNAAIVVNGDNADQISALSYDPSNDTAPFTITGAIGSTLPHPLLPGAAVHITRGGLLGRVLVTELLAVRQLQFRSDGTIEDVSQLAWPNDIPEIVGTIGIQP